MYLYLLVFAFFIAFRIIDIAVILDLALFKLKASKMVTVYWR